MTEYRIGAHYVGTTEMYMAGFFFLFQNKKEKKRINLFRSFPGY